MSGVLFSLAILFAELSLLAFGGGNSVLPEMQRRVVEVHHWMTAQEFSALFALAQAAPGPNLMIVPVIGWRVAGWAGLLTSSVAMFGPSSVLIGVVLGLWRRFRHKPWRRVVQAGLVPLTVGLVASSALLIARTSDTTWGLVGVTALATVVGLEKRVHPLWILAGGGLLGLAGLARF